MRNYYLQQNDLVIAEARLNTLKSKLKRLDDKITSCTSRLKEVVVSGGSENDKLDRYLIEKEEVLEEIAEITNYIKQIKSNLKQMENALREMHEIQEEVFVMFHIEGLKPKQIARKIPCDISTVYKHLKEINKIISTRQKNRKIS